MNEDVKREIKALQDSVIWLMNELSNLKNTVNRDMQDKWKMIADLTKKINNEDKKFEGELNATH